MRTQPNLASRIANAAIVVLTFALFLTVQTPSMQAQTYSVIHNFLGGPDGDEPAYGMAIDAHGILYGSTFEGDEGTGTIFRVRHVSSGWQLTTLYIFTGGSDGAVPYGGAIVGPNGSLYGTTAYGGLGPCVTWGGKTGCGTVFNMQPPTSSCKTALCYWGESVLNLFTGPNGATPYGGQPIFDSAGNLYGTTYSGGSSTNCTGGCGLVWKLTRSGNSWSQQVLYTFTGTAGDGAFPWAGVVFDVAGNLYGTTEFGGAYGYGTVYELSPNGSGWSEKIVYSFQDGQDGGEPYAGVILDHSGNLYGATTIGGSGAGGTVFELSPAGSNWNFQTLHAFTRQAGELAGGPVANLAMDSAGNLYGATGGDGAYGFGSVFKMTLSTGNWTLNSLYDFTGGNDGRLPRSNLVIDSSGNLYGTAAGGQLGHGVVYEITQ